MKNIFKSPIVAVDTITVVIVLSTMFSQRTSIFDDRTTRKSLLKLSINN